MTHKVTPVGLHVHRAERTDVLAEALAELLANPPGDAPGDGH